MPAALAEAVTFEVVANSARKALVHFAIADLLCADARRPGLIAIWFDPCLEIGEAKGRLANRFIAMFYICTQTA
jgi:hypothetical protein